MLHIAAIDDHELIRAGIASVFNTPGSGFHATTYETLAEFEEAIAGNASFDLVLLDLGLKGFTGLKALEHYRSLFSDTSVIVLSAHDASATILAALECGAMGFISKSSSNKELTSAMRIVASGQVYAPTDALRQAGLTDNGRWEAAAQRQAPGSSLYDCLALEGLTHRQRDVLALLVRGLPNKLICRHLNLSENTVKTHLAAVFGVLGVHSRTQALLRVQQLGVRLDLHRPDGAAVGDPR